MQERPYTLFISDLHLQEATPKITACFLSFLEEHSAKADALYILGDFFEAWIGDDDYSRFNQQISTALRAAHARGLKTYLMVGNRDFLLSSGFASAAATTLIADPTLIDLYGTPILLTHGDNLCTLDIQYQKLRRITHNPLAQAIALIFPLSIRRYAAKKMRARSKQRYGKLDPAIIDVTLEATLDLLAKHQVKHMIHGHTHRPAIHKIDLNNKKSETEKDTKIDIALDNENSALRIVLDAWFEHGNALFCYADGKVELKNF